MEEEYQIDERYLIRVSDLQPQLLPRPRVKVIFVEVGMEEVFM